MRRQYHVEMPTPLHISGLACGSACMRALGVPMASAGREISSRSRRADDCARHLCQKPSGTSTPRTYPPAASAHLTVQSFHAKVEASGSSTWLTQACTREPQSTSDTEMSGAIRPCVGGEGSQ
ncbi:hypothetical protein JX265_011877 [Neoarthrinium moseri]|uniref:Uncharacterized protein n=1 Tax=Neoarthrinium moseri TaxID=1658444 RepID=A0A9P9WBX1_9PEZI|nr:hypothetical protein JX265_011877 [Neoarthrinium moseri]